MKTMKEVGRGWSTFKTGSLANGSYRGGSSGGIMMTISRLLYLTLLLLLTHTTTSNISTTNTFPITEVQALYDLYTVNYGQYWVWQSAGSTVYQAPYPLSLTYNASGSRPWNFTAFINSHFTSIGDINPCIDHWQGVLCTSTNDHVQYLILPGYGLNGSLPVSITALPRLQILDLTGNSLIGSLPSSLGTLQHMQGLILQNNLFKSRVPSSIFTNLTNLLTLDLSVNAFNGSIPSDIHHLQLLQVLDVSFNYFIGTIPETLGMLPRIQMLTLSSNKFTTTPLPPSLLNSTSLLSFSMNYLGFHIPLPIFHAPLLRYLSMSYNQFYGHIPVDFFKHVPSLTYLNLNINFLNGSIPSTLKYATQLNYLSINDNHLSGSIPSVFGYLKNLSYVDLSSNALTNTFPATSLLQANQSLEYLYLFLNRMNGSIPSDFLIIMQNLKEFSVRLNEMTGLLPFPPLQKGEEESFHCQDYADQYALQVFSVSNNYFKGSISNTVCMFTSLYYFDVEVNDLTGTLPNTLCRNMSSLITLTASGNLFHGTLPNDMFVTMEALQTVDLGYNNFNGTLPSALSKNGGFPLIFLDLSQNNFQGSIPQAFYQFTAITSLSLRSTQLMGNLSQDIKEWRVLDRLDISLNAFTGSLPSAFCELLRLQTVLIDNNLFTGPLLSCLSTMPLLGDVYFGENMFTNSLPSSIWLTPSLSYLDISSNEMDGIIVLPSALDMQYFSMTSLFLSDNMFEGDITSLLQFWMYVEDVVLDYNLISGSITEDCLSSKNIIYSLNLEHNYIHGTLPATIGYLLDLESLKLSENLFSGILPVNLFSAKNLVVLNVSSNAFTGTIPTQVRQLGQVQSLDFSYNNFTGSISNHFATLPYLSILFLVSNQLTGTITSLINSTLQTWLTNADVSDNKFTGLLPSDIFQAPTLLSFAAVKNCFTGSIPSSICSATLLQTLALDGLHSAAGCTHKIYSSLSHSLFTTIISMSSYELSSAIDGSIPSCIYSLPNLHTMHLSGNGIRDTFPSFAVSRWSKDLPISASLTDLSLSHNSLRGEIPSAIQQHAWYNLDLSFNALSGTLEDGFLAPDLYNTSLGIQSTSSLSLVVNRLSGTIPKTIQNLLNIDILQGNIFSCSTGASIASDLPQNDEHVASYECGSDSVNTACYVFLACLCTTAILLATSYAIYVYISETTKPLRERLKKLLEQLEKYWYMFHPSQSHHGDQESSMVRFSNLNLQYRFFMLAITAYIMLILMPTYIGLASSYSTYSHKYAYAISLAYLSGTVPAGLLFSLIIILYALVKFPLLMLWESTKRVTRLEDSDYSSTGDSNSATVSQISSSVQSLSNTTDVPQSNILSDSQPSSNIFSANLHYSSLYWKWYAQWYMPVFFILLLNIMVVLVINMAYVYSSSVTFTTPTIPVFISFAMTAFKIGWNNQLTVKILPRELFRLKATILPQHPWVVQSNSRPVQQAIAKQMDQLIMLVLILLSIFNNVIAAYISSIFINPNCFYYTIYSLPAIEASYSYTYCKQFFVVPHISSCLQSETLTRQTAYNPPFIYNYQCSSSLLTTFINIYMYRYIFGGIVTPILQLAAKVLLDYLLSVTSSTPEKTYIGTVIVLLKKYVPPALQVPLPTSDQKSTGNDEVTLLSSNTVEFKKFFNRESYIVRIVGDIAVLLTFGAVFPPLALLIAVCSVLNTLYVQLLLGRLLHVVAELKEQHETTAQKTMDYLKEFPSFLSKELRNIDHDCALALPYFSVLMVAFFSFSLFDTLADSVGNAGAIWIVIFLMTLPIADYSLFFLYQNRKELYGRMMNWYSRYCCGASKVTNTAVTSVVEMSTNALHLNEEGNSNEQTDT